MRERSKDLRVRRTLTAVRKAFNDLVLARDYHDISITDLTDKAGINRKTFYLHYSSLDDLVAEVEEEVATDILKHIGKYAESLDLNGCITNFYKYLESSTKVQKKLLCDEGYAFFYCEKLASVTIGDGVSELKDHVFYRCNALKHLSIGKSVTTIGTMAFFSCKSLQQVTIPNSVVTIGQEAFELCTGLTKVTFGNSLTKIELAAFSSCTALSDVRFPNSLVFIGPSAFQKCNFTNLVLPNSILQVKDNAFSECASLKSLTIPATVTDIRCFAFLDCVNLETIRCHVINPNDSFFETYCFMGVPTSTCVVHVPQGSLTAYRNHPVWREFTHIVEMGSEVVGDVNGDGEVNIADVNAIIDIILSGSTNNPVADVNSDDEVNIADINTIIDLILSAN